MSMIVLMLMGMLEKPCQELFQSINELFNGLYVYLFGDFHQLPPVRDLPLYSDTFTDESSIHIIVFLLSFNFSKNLQNLLVNLR